MTDNHHDILHSETELSHGAGPAGRQLSVLDRLIVEADNIVRTLVTKGASATRESPAKHHQEATLTETERKHVAGLMRVNHTGEVCAQALYQGQALTAKTAGTRVEMEEAAQEEIDHLVWCEERLEELGAAPSALKSDAPRARKTRTRAPAGQAMSPFSSARVHLSGVMSMGATARGAAYSSFSMVHCRGCWLRCANSIT